ncbi:MAG: hypothetical protein K0S33_3036 [Bacteroidetes bacterium]|jgi:hypothetical protein|nr:hypothetical protein [Bacteroidota bacterium]
MTALLNERHAVKNDAENRMSLPEIGTQRQLLLIYEASEELHAAGLKGRILGFLNAYEVKVTQIEGHLNSSLYFKVNNPFTDVMLRKLATDFEEFISELETEFDGRIFWLFNTVAQIKIDDPQSIRAAIVGKGNQTLRDELQEQIKALPESDELQSL